MNDLTGQRFGKWVVIKFDGIANKHSRWICKCDCGTIKSVEVSTLKSGKSAGCAKCRKPYIKHGMSNEKIYGVWHGMIQRCENKNAKAYPNYGGRGIKVCEEWHEFTTFYDWAINSGYGNEVEIDRINVNGNYEPENCRWITHKAQQSNKRNNTIITYNGFAKTLSEWANTLGIKSNTLCERIKMHGIQKALASDNVGRGHKIL